MLGLLLVHGLQSASVDVLLSVGDHLYQLFLPAVPFDLGALPFVYLLAVALELLLAAADLLVQLLFPRLLFLQLALQCLVLGLQFLAFLDNAVYSFADALHLFFQTLCLLFLRHRCFQLRLQRLQLLLLPRPCGLYQKQQKLGPISRVLLLHLQQPLIVVHSHLNLFLQRPRLALQLLRVDRMIMMILLFKYLTIVVLVTHPLSIINQLMSCNTAYCPQYFFGYIGVASALIFANLGAAYGSAKAGVGICSMGVLKPELIMKSVVPVVMAGILGIYGMIVAVIIVQRITADNYSDKAAYAHLASGLCCGFSSLAAGLSIGIVGDAGVRANAQQEKIFVGMILILIFGEALALYGLIVSLILTSQ